MDVMETETQTRRRANLERLLRPQSIAIVGASAKPGSFGESLLINLKSSGYGGEVYLVNPKRPIIDGKACLGGIEELPEGVDCAVLAIPGSAVLGSLQSCAARGVGSVIVYSAGFAEAGAEGKSLQDEMTRIAREHEMVVLGPNCLGMVNYLSGIPLTFVVTPPQEQMDRPGAAILSQSGALAAVIAVNMRHQAIPLTYSVSTGNEATTGIEDFVEHLLHDASTGVFALVVEQFREPRRFLELAKRARELGKWIVLLHPGRSSAARASAATHTGAIAGDYDVMRTLVRHAGVIHVECMEELVDVVQILVRRAELPRGGAAVFTESGAFKAHAMDVCDAVGLELPALSRPCEASLRAALPAFIHPSNPLDITAHGLVDPDLYRRTLPAILDDDGFGSVMLGIILTDRTTTQLKMPPIVKAIREIQPQKPVIFAALDEGAPFDFPELEELRHLGVACYPSPERALRALAYVSRVPEVGGERADDGARHFEIPECPSGLLSEADSKRVLRQIGIAIPAGRMARDVDEAVVIASEIGYPVALKAQSAQLPHKSDVGGVILDVRSAEEVRDRWLLLEQNVRWARPDLVLDGVLVERMGERGLELIVGAKRDSQWGPVLMAGFGGVLAEVIGDVRLMPCDLSRFEIEQELRQLHCAALLQGFRGGPALDASAVAATMEAISMLMWSCAEVDEVDINPLVVLESGRGVMALDALIAMGRNERASGKDEGVNFS